MTTTITHQPWCDPTQHDESGCASHRFGIPEAAAMALEVDNEVRVAIDPRPNALFTVAQVRAYAAELVRLADTIEAQS